jgi:hypothetical protein
MKATITSVTSSATYERDNVKVEITDTTIDGQTKRRARIIDKSSAIGAVALSIEGPELYSLASILKGIDLP